MQRQKEYCASFGDGSSEDSAALLKRQNKTRRLPGCYAMDTRSLPSQRRHLLKLSCRVAFDEGLSEASELGLGLGLLCNDARLRWCLNKILSRQIALKCFSWARCALRFSPGHLEGRLQKSFQMRRSSKCRRPLPMAQKPMLRGEVILLKGMCGDS